MRLEPITLRGSGVQLEPLSEHHAQALLAAAADRSTFGFIATLRLRTDGRTSA